MSAVPGVRLHDEHEAPPEGALDTMKRGLSLNPELRAGLLA
ncbi:MAG: hypothetical protein ACJA2F_000764, partial [Nitriliruptoraceae bacterium]